MLMIIGARNENIKKYRPDFNAHWRASVCRRVKTCEEKEMEKGTRVCRARLNEEHIQRYMGTTRMSSDSVDTLGFDLRSWSCWERILYLGYNRSANIDTFNVVSREKKCGNSVTCAHTWSARWVTTIFRGDNWVTTNPTPDCSDRWSRYARRLLGRMVSGNWLDWGVQKQERYWITGR